MRTTIILFEKTFYLIFLMPIVIVKSFVTQWYNFFFFTSRTIVQISHL